ncbi:hypothetical protein ACQUSR_11435 [Streptomyces sp. P1-3]|uniref:hypothetical protein n=1 Tax=Streptomyces sp. P1-3 TaxID=3421658 RepID=UPI003D36FC36
MFDAIARCLTRVRRFLALRPAGRHRAPGAAHVCPGPRVILVWPWDPPQHPTPRHRRNHIPPIDGDTLALARPYLVAYELRLREGLGR